MQSISNLSKKIYPKIPYCKGTPPPNPKQKIIELAQEVVRMREHITVVYLTNYRIRLLFNTVKATNYWDCNNNVSIRQESSLIGRL